MYNIGIVYIVKFILCMCFIMIIFSPLRVFIPSLAITESVEENVGESLDKERAKRFETVKLFSKL